MADTEVTPSAGFPVPAAMSDASWGELIPADQWAVFVDGTDALRSARAPFLLGGALALATYTGHWRNTKDIDVVIDASHREAVMESLRGEGFEDYFDKQAYDRSWIFRGFKNGVLFDVIWALPNHRVEIDAAWFHRAHSISLRGATYSVVPPEELVRVKLYVMQRERCDWVDVLNVLAAASENLSWPWLVERMDRDLPLLHAALAIFNWMCPGRAHALPVWLRKQFALPLVKSEDFRVTEAKRVLLFDSRPWFAMHQPLDRPLER